MAKYRHYQHQTFATISSEMRSYSFNPIGNFWSGHTNTHTFGDVLFLWQWKFPFELIRTLELTTINNWTFKNARSENMAMRRKRIPELKLNFQYWKLSTMDFVATEMEKKRHKMVNASKNVRLWLLSNRYNMQLEAKINCFRKVLCVWTWMNVHISKCFSLLSSIYASWQCPNCWKLAAFSLNEQLWIRKATLDFAFRREREREWNGTQTIGNSLHFCYCFFCIFWQFNQFKSTFIAVKIY